MKKKRRKKKKIEKGFIDKAIIFCGIMFVATFLFGVVAFSIWQSEPEHLFDLVKTLCGAEGFFAMALSITKLKNKKDDNDE